MQGEGEGAGQTQGQPSNTNQQRPSSPDAYAAGQGPEPGQGPVQQAPLPQQPAGVSPTQPVSAPSQPQPPPPDSSAPPPQVPQPGKNKSKTIILILAILILIVAGFGGFFLGASGLINGRLTPTPTPTPAAIFDSTPVVVPTDTPTPTPDPAADWRVFEHEKFTFKYPPYLPEPAVKTDEDGDEVTPKTYESLYKEEGQEAVAYSVLFRIVGPEQNPEQMKLKEWLGENNRLVLGEEVDAEVINATLGGNEAVLVSGIDKESGILTSTRIYYELEDGIYSISFNIEKTSPSAATYETDFQFLLSTFSFK